MSILVDLDELLADHYKPRLIVLGSQKYALYKRSVQLVSNYEFSDDDPRRHALRPTYNGIPIVIDYMSPDCMEVYS